jgi:hypothetical protein
MDERRTGEFSESALGPKPGAPLVALGAGLILLGGLAALSRGRAEGAARPRKRSIFAVILALVGVAIFVWRRLESLEPTAAESPLADLGSDDADRLADESLLAEAEALAVALQSELAELDEVVAAIAEEPQALESETVDLGGWRLVARAANLTGGESNDPSRGSDHQAEDAAGDGSEDEAAAAPLTLVQAAEDLAGVEGVVARVGMYSPHLAAKA